MRHRERTGILLSLAAALAFGGLPILTKLAYAHGLGVVGLLSLRFAIAAVALWCVVALLRRPLPSRTRMARGVGLGATVFALSSGMFFGALTRLDAGLADLLMYTYPALVTAGTVMLGREVLSVRRVLALSVSGCGIALVLVGGGIGAIDAIGTLLALSAAAMYTVFVLTQDSAVRSTDPIVLTALTVSGAAISFAGVAMATEGVPIGISFDGWMIVVALSLVATVLPYAMLTIGMRLAGASTASIAVSLEPAVAVLFAFLILGNRLAPPQLAGAGLVLVAIVVLQARLRSRLAARIALRAGRPALAARLAPA